MNELFEVGESLSPKLAWLRKHRLVTKYDANLEGSPESPETGEDCHPWLVTQADVIELDQFSLGTGETEEAAIIDYCERTGTPHYSVDSPASPRGTQGAPDSSLPERG